MRKLRKETRELFDSLYDRLDELAGDVECAVNAYNEVIREFNELQDEVTCEIENYTSERSDRWHESERAELYGDWSAFFEDHLDEMDDIEAEHGDAHDVPLSVDEV
mgnify:CR=1 FL=1|tara:strand:+ start:153 stop:470 length:318 start_codon:yes stop_codon:yes gene_type:complete